MKNYEIFIVVPYFGKLPNYIQLWLNSCSRNPDYNWLLITDDVIEGYAIPDNVFIKHLRFKEIKTIFQNNLNQPICLDSPYKLCDYRPLYWMILDELNINYDFYGHCDLDVIFGNLKTFVTNDVLKVNNRIFSNGHLTLYKNDYLTKNLYLLDGAEISFTKVVQTKNNLGFDEHHGINMICNKWQIPWYKANQHIADILPGFDQMFRTNPMTNHRNQLFFYRNGHCYQGWKTGDGWKEVELAYIHFQKRPIRDLNASSDYMHFYLSENSFVELDDDNTNLERYLTLVDQLNQPLSFNDKVKLFRIRLRNIKNMRIME